LQEAPAPRATRVGSFVQTITAILLLTAGLIGATQPATARSAPAAARSASIVIDYTTGTVLEESDPDATRYPASLTKMMTLYLIFEALAQNRIQLATRWPISVHAARQNPTKLNLIAGQTVAVQDVLLGLITRSANDAAVVAAEGLGGSESGFAMMMTARARALGMNSTTFQNASGLPDTGQVTSPRDLVTLARALIHDFPQYYGYFSIDEFTFRGRRIGNHNRLMATYAGADGLKTGYIRAAGYNLAFSAVRDGRRLVGVVMGGRSALGRDYEMARLFDAAFVRAATLPRASEAMAQRPALVPTPGDEPVVVAVRGRRGARGVEVAAATPAPRATGARDWAIQVGAFSTMEQGRTAANRAVALARGQLAQGAVEITGGDVRGRPVYRARLTNLTEDQARQACRTLTRQRMSCNAVAPTPETRVAQR
jgi:D-alanyl-D-alanine carboxypeptidase